MYHFLLSHPIYTQLTITLLDPWPLPDVRGEAGGMFGTTKYTCMTSQLPGHPPHYSQLWAVLAVQLLYLMCLCAVYPRAGPGMHGRFFLPQVIVLLLLCVSLFSLFVLAALYFPGRGNCDLPHVGFVAHVVYRHQVLALPSFDPFKLS